MAFIWDYSVEEIKKKEQGKVLLLERDINFGPDGDKKIPLDQVKKYWERLNLFPKSKRLMELFIWGKIRS